MNVANLGTPQIPDLFADNGPSLADSIDININIEPPTQRHLYIHARVTEILRHQDGKYGITGTGFLKFRRFPNFNMFLSWNRNS